MTLRRHDPLCSCRRSCILPTAWPSQARVSTTRSRSGRSRRCVALRHLDVGVLEWWGCTVSLGRGQPKEEDMKRLLFLCTLATLSLGAMGGVAVAAQGDFAAGGGNDGVGHFNFSAHQTETLHARGHMSYRSSTQVVRAEVLCMHVQGNRAFILGEIDPSKSSGTPVGATRIAFEALDEQGGDGLSVFFAGPDPRMSTPAVPGSSHSPWEHRRPRQPAVVDQRRTTRPVPKFSIDCGASAAPSFERRLVSQADVVFPNAPNSHVLLRHRPRSIPQAQESA